MPDDSIHVTEPLSKGHYVFKYTDIKTLQKVGHGNEGVVFQALAGCFGTVAFKELSQSVRIDQIDQKENVEFARELRYVLEHTHHPNIVRVYGVVQNVDRYVGYIMEYVENGSLKTVLEKLGKDLTANTRYSWSMQAAAAVAFLHSRAIIHRDVKPDNFLVSKDYQTVKITDLGLARFRQNASVLSRGIGTYNYMAPEMFMSQEYTNKVDIYGLAMTIYYIATGTRPFSHVNEKGIFVDNQAFHQNLRPDKTIVHDPNFSHILPQMWDSKPEGRLEALKVFEYFSKFVKEDETFELNSGESNSTGHLSHVLTARENESFQHYPESMYGKWEKVRTFFLPEPLPIGSRTDKFEPLTLIFERTPDRQVVHYTIIKPNENLIEDLIFDGEWHGGQRLTMISHNRFRWEFGKQASVIQDADWVLTGDLIRQELYNRDSQDFCCIFKRVDEPDDMSVISMLEVNQVPS